MQEGDARREESDERREFFISLFGSRMARIARKFSKEVLDLKATIHQRVPEKSK